MSSDNPKVNSSDSPTKEIVDNEFTIRYGGKQPEIDANTFIHSLLSVTVIIQETNRELGTGRPLDIKIKAHQPGSFLVHLELLGFLEAVKSLLTQENLKTAGEIIGAVVGLIAIRKHLKGQEPAQQPSLAGGNVTIENVSGSRISVDNRVFNLSLNNLTIRTALNDNFTTLSNDPNISEFEILDKKDTKLVTVEREEFQELIAEPSEVVQTIEQRKPETTTAPLYIVKPSFDPQLKWEFLFQGFRIAALIKDKIFLARIDTGEKFAKGDVLEVELKINQVWNDSIGAFENKTYEVLNVISHIERPQQAKLFDDSSSLSK